MAETAKKLHLSVVTPANAFYEGEADYAQIPVYDGLIGVLVDHSPYMGLLGYGILTFRNNGEEKRLVIDGGFLEINDNRVNVLANSADTVENISEEAARKLYDEALQMHGKGEVEADMRMEKLQSARARLRYLKHA
jgi:F-type H+-transporting ATPase subunit epsilon